MALTAPVVLSGDVNACCSTQAVFPVKAGTVVGGLTLQLTINSEGRLIWRSRNLILAVGTEELSSGCN